MGGLPSGVVTFLLTDIEGSTRLWEREPAEMGRALERHDAILESTVTSCGGVLLKQRGEGDSTFSVFERPTQAVVAALEIRRALGAEQWPEGCPLDVRFAVHTGEVTDRGADYYGTAVNRAARIRGLAAGGQILVSEAVAAVVADNLPEHVALVPLGEHELRGLARAERLAAVVDTRHPTREALGGACPYRGLLAFQPEDHDLYFGREELVADLLAQLVDSRMLVVVGASGSGKSSLVRAGVIAALQDGAVLDSATWTIRIMTPKSDPLGALNEVGGVDTNDTTRVVILVDQMEEMFTNCRDPEERSRFVDVLLDAIEKPDGAVIVIGALRADFYGHCASVPRLAAALSKRSALLAPMSEQELRRTIEGPAELVGLRLDAGLADLMLSDLAREPGSLPLLSHALLETWRRRSGRTMTVAGYHDAGGVRSAIAHTAEAVWNTLAVDEQAVARRIFLRLTELGEGTEDTRRRVPRSELAIDAESRVDDVLRTLTAARLVIADDDGVEVAHEALIRQWPRLRQWLDEDREVIRVHRHLTYAARDWLAVDRDNTELYRGPRLVAARQLLDDPDRVQLSATEAEFLDASIDAEEAEARADEERQRARDRANRRLRALLAAAAIALVVALIAGSFAFRQRDRANAQAGRAQQATVSAEVDRVVAEMPKILRSDRELAGLLAVQAIQLRPDPTTQGALLGTLLDESRLRYTARGGFHDDTTVAPFPDGKHVVTAASGGVNLWDTAAGKLVTSIRIPHTYAVDVTADGAAVGIGTADGVISFWDGALTRQIGEPLRLNAPIADLAFSPDSRTIAIAFGRPGSATTAQSPEVPRLVDVATRRTIRLLPGQPSTTNVIGFAPTDGDLVATAGNDGSVLVHDARTGRVTNHFTLPGALGSLSFSPNGRFLAVGGIANGAQDHSVGVFDLVNSAPIAAPLRGSEGRTDVRFNRDGTRLIVGDGTGIVREWRTLDWNSAATPIQTQHGPTLVADTNGGDVVSAGFDGTISAWSIDGAPAVDRTMPGSLEAGGVFNRDGTVIATVSNDDRVRVERSADSRVLADLHVGVTGQRDDIAGPVHAAFSPDGHLLAVDSRDGRIQFFDSRTYRPLGAPVQLMPAFSEGLLFSPDGRLLVGWNVQDGEHGVYALDIATRRPVVLDRAVPHPVQASFSPDGTRFVVGGVGNSGFEFPVKDGKFGPGRTLPQLGSNISQAVFSPDGRTLAVGTLEGSITLFDSATLRPRGEAIAVPSGVVALIVFSPDGRFLVAEDQGTRSVHLIDLHANAQIGDPIPGVPKRYGWPTFSPDGRMLVLPKPGASMLLDLDPKHWRTAACVRAARALTRDEWSVHFSAVETYAPACNA